MFLTEFHVHSNVSADSPGTMREMAEAEVRAGIRILCFTDHCDLLNKQDMAFQPGRWRSSRKHCKLTVHFAPKAISRWRFASA